MTIEQQALDRVMKARARLILERRFYGVLVSNVEPQISRRVPTAATNGKVHLWNPEFVMGLTDAELLGVQVHESEHDARHHGTRRASRDPVEWNAAGDFAINIDLIAEGFTLPKGAYIDAKYAGMSTEDIYRMRELDQQREQDQPEPEDDEQDSDDDGDDEADDNQPGDGQDDDTDDGDDEGDDGDSGEDADGDSGDESGDEGDGADADGGDADGSGQSEGDGADTDGGDADGGSGSGEGGDGEAGGQGGGEPGEGEGQLGSGDAGGCGEVLDSEVGNGEAELAEDDAKWDRVVRQAVSMAKAVGQLPGHITREIERANNPVRDWRDELREFAEEGALRIETWNRPNRRFIGRGVILPSTQKDGINKAAFLIDTSGSCDHVALACVRDEAQAMLDDGIIDHVVVVYGDTVVTRVDEYVTGDEIEFDPRGGGGTDMEPLFDFVASEHDDASLIVCFTDLEFYKSCGAEPAAPVLWAVHGYPQRVQQVMQNTPWQARAIDVGAH